VKYLTQFLVRSRVSVYYLLIYVYLPQELDLIDAKDLIYQGEQTS